MMLPLLVDSWLPQAVGWALIHSLWQGLILSLALLSSLALSRSPRVRYASGLTAMALILVLFVATLALSVPQTGPRSPAHGAGPAIDVLIDDPARLSPGTAPSRLHLVAPYLSMFWVAGVCVCHLWQLAGLVSVRRLRRRGAWPAMQQWELELRRLAERLRVTRPVALVESLMVNTPVVVGHLRPLILVPAGLLTRLPVWQVEAILLHELAHIRRCDYIVNLIQRWVEGLFFYNPAIWWISRVIRCEREACCDDMAAEVCGDRYRYAGALAALEESRFPTQDAPALAATGGSLRNRIDRLLRQNPPTGARALVSFLTILGAVSTLAFAGWQTNAPPSLTAAAQAEPDEASPYRKWLNEDVVYLITDADRAAFERLRTDQERQIFIERFWQQREASAPPGSRGSAKEEHYRRIAYANARWATGIPGWKTDRGRIYIVWGPPKEIESHPSAQGGRPPYEMWRHSGISGSRFFTFVDVDNNGDYKLQTQETAAPSVFNRILRFTVVDPLNRFVTGLAQEHFSLREQGESKSIRYFEAPGTPVAVAVVSDTIVPGLNELPSLDQPVIQSRTLEDAVARLRASSAVRKALIIVRGAASPAGAIPGGIHAVVADTSMVGKTIVEITNQYVAGYRSDSPGDPELTVKPIAGLPALRIGSVR